MPLSSHQDAATYDENSGEVTPLGEQFMGERNESLPVDGNADGNVTGSITPGTTAGGGGNGGGNGVSATWIPSIGYLGALAILPLLC